MGFTFNNRELVVNVSVDEVTEVTGITTIPPVGKYRITNIYVDPDTGRVNIEYDDTPVT